MADTSKDAKDGKESKDSKELQNYVVLSSADSDDLAIPDLNRLRATRFVLTRESDRTVRSFILPGTDREDSAKIGSAKLSEKQLLSNASKVYMAPREIPETAFKDIIVLYYMCSCFEVGSLRAPSREGLEAVVALVVALKPLQPWQPWTWGHEGRKILSHPQQAQKVHQGMLPLS